MYIIKYISLALLFYIHTVDTIKTVKSPTKETTFTVQPSTIFENDHSVADYNNSVVLEIDLSKLKQLINFKIMLQ